MTISLDIFGRRALGLDIGPERVAGVVVERRPGGGIIRAAEYVTVRLEDELFTAVDVLLKKQTIRAETSCLGLPESRAFLRNIELPFRDRKKISRILPLELEEQLLHRGDELVMDFLMGSGGNETSDLLVAAMRRTEVGEYLKLLSGHGRDPEPVTLRSLTLGSLLARGKGQENILLLNLDPHSATMALYRGGKPVFARFLSYPEHLFGTMPFVLRKGVLYSPDTDDAMLCIAELCKEVNRSLAFLQCEHNIDGDVTRCLLTGGLALAEMVTDGVHTGLGVPVEVADLRQERGLSLADPVARQWQAPLFDHALALALTAGSGKRDCINLRRGEFRKKFRLLRSKRQAALAAALVLFLLVAAAGYSLFGYMGLKNRYEALGRQMNQLFLATFPGTGRIVDPLQQMKVNLRSAEESGVTAPAIGLNKRILELLADISRRIPPELEIHVARLLVDEESVQIKGTTDTFNTVDSIQNRLRQSPLYSEVAIMSATADKNRDRIRFQIRLSLAEKNRG